MGDVNFVSADIEKIEQFEKESAEAITEFNAIKTEFENINSNLLKSWQGDGAGAYAEETAHILENVGGIEDVLNVINESVIKDVKEEYMKLDEELGEFNRNPPIIDESNGQ